MPDITMHLTANFYPPIPHDIQLRVQEIFDELVEDSDPYILGWKGDEASWEYEVSDDSVFDREYDLPNGATVIGRDLLEDLRLWDALWWDCGEPEELYADHLREMAQIPEQMEHWRVSSTVKSIERVDNESR